MGSKRYPITIAIILVLGSFHSSAQWTADGYGVFGNTFYSVYTNGTVALAGTTSQGIFVSLDNGSSWHASNTGLTSPLISCLAGLGSRLFAGTGSGLFVSNDNGTTWTFAGVSDYIYGLCVSGSNIFASANNGPFLSTDGGLSWVPVTTGIPSGSGIGTLASGGTYLFGGNSNGEVYVSSDQGSHWIKTPLNAYYIYSLAVNGSDVFAASNAGLYHSPDLGVTWVLLNNAPSPILSLIVSAGKVFASTTQNIYATSDNGTTWSSSGGINGNSIPSMAAHGSDLYAASYGGGVIHSTDNGLIWNPANNGLVNLPAQNLVVDGNYFYAQAFNGIVRSSDGGTTWSTSNSGLSDPNISAIVVKGDSIMVGTWLGNMFLSTDHGASWIPSGSGLPSLGITSLTVSGNNIFAGTNAGLFMSSDGSSWSSVVLGAPSPAIRATIAKGNDIFVVSNTATINYSADQGATWISTGTLNYIKSLAIAGGNLVAGTDIGLFTSSNLGMTWTQVGSNALTGGVNTLSASGNNVFLVAGSTDVYLFSGNSLTSLSTGLPPYYRSVPALVPIGSEVFAIVNTADNQSGSIWHRSILSLPTITALSNVQGTVGSVVTITGSNFSASRTGNLIQFNNVLAPVLQATTDSLVVVVPSTYGNATIQVTTKGKSVTSLTSFKIIPNITGFTPDRGYAGTSVIVNGTGLDPSLTTVYFNGTSSFGTTTNTSISTSVPDFATSGPITVLIGGLLYASPGTFTVLPFVTGFSPTSGSSGTEVNIQGSGFGSVTDDVIVTFNSITAQITYRSPKGMVVNAPPGVQTGPITVSVNGNLAQEQVPFVVLPLPAFCFDPPPQPSISVLGSATPNPVILSSSPFGNQWFLDGSPMPGATDSVLMVRVSGSYSVQVTQLGCQSPVSTVQVVTVTDAVTGFPEPVSGSRALRVFPNPATDVIMINLDSFQKDKLVDIECFNALGRCLASFQQEGGNQVPLQLANYPSGVYLIRASQMGSNQQARFVKP